MRVNEKLDDTCTIAKVIVNSGLGLKEMSITNISIEDYYLSVTGGKHNG